HAPPPRGGSDVRRDVGSAVGAEDLELRWISSWRSSASQLCNDAWPPARNSSRQWVSVPAATPTSRAKLSSGSPRRRPRIPSVFRRAEKRPGSRPPSASDGTAARVTSVTVAPRHGHLRGGPEDHHVPQR